MIKFLKNFTSFFSGSAKKKPSTVSTNKQSKYHHAVTVNLDSSYTLKSREMMPMKDIYTDKEVWGIGANVQLIREDKGLTQKQLSELLGYKSTSFISRLELWELEKIKYEQIENLANCLSVDVNEILNAKYWHD